MLLYGYYPATILSYNAEERTAQISIPGMTDGAEDGLTAEFAYPVGEDDRDTERLVKFGAEVWIFFEMGQANAPIIAFYRGHQVGAVVDVRRIRQKNIEILATQQVSLEAPVFRIKGRLILEGDFEQTGNFEQTGDFTSTGTVTGQTDVVAGSVSGKSHEHGGVMPGNSQTNPPTPST
jgi:hypothetical protein